MPPRPAHAELNLAIQLAPGQTLATCDEPIEIDELASATASEASLSVEELARDFVDITLEDILTTKSVSHASTPKGCRPSTSVNCPELCAANTWVAQWRSTNSLDRDKPRAFTYQLRAYALWHNQQHSITAAAALLRDPPLQKATVAAYVLDALKAEELPFEATRLRKVLDYLPESSQARYKKILKRME